MEVQTRSEENGIELHDSLEAAHKAASDDPTIWKISYDADGHRVRLVKEQGVWVRRDLMNEVRTLLDNNYWTV